MLRIGVTSLGCPLLCWGNNRACGALTAIPCLDPAHGVLFMTVGKPPQPVRPQLPRAYFLLTRVGPADWGGSKQRGWADPDLWLPCQLLLDQQVALKRYEVAGRRVLFYFDEVLPVGNGGLLGTHTGEGTVGRGVEQYSGVKH